MAKCGDTLILSSVFVFVFTCVVCVCACSEIPRLISYSYYQIIQREEGYDAGMCVTMIYDLRKMAQISQKTVSADSEGISREYFFFSEADEMKCASVPTCNSRT